MWVTGLLGRLASQFKSVLSLLGTDHKCSHPGVSRHVVLTVLVITGIAGPESALVGSAGQAKSTTWHADRSSVSVPELSRDCQGVAGTPVPWCGSQKGASILS